MIERFRKVEFCAGLNKKLFKGCDDMKLKIGKFERIGEITARETISDYLVEVQKLVRGNTYVSVPTWIKKDMVTLETVEGEQVIYYEVFHGTELVERYLDYKYQRTTPEFKQEFENFCKYGPQALIF